MLPAEMVLEIPALSEERVVRHKFSCQMYLSHQMKILCKSKGTGMCFPLTFSSMFFELMQKVSRMSQLLIGVF